MQRIRELRAERGLTQVRLAVAADMNPATLNRIEQGKANPNLKTLERLAEALGVGLADLLVDDSPKAQASLWPEEGLERRDPYAPWLEFVEQYASRWDAKISAGELDAASLDEWIATVEALTPVLRALNAEEIRHVPEEEKLSSFGAPGAKTGVALWRLLDLIEPIIDAGVEVWSNSELERLRRRKAEMYQEKRASAAG